MRNEKRREVKTDHHDTQLVPQGPFSGGCPRVPQPTTTTSDALQRDARAVADHTSRESRMKRGEQPRLPPPHATVEQRLVGRPEEPLRTRFGERSELPWSTYSIVDHGARTPFACFRRDESPSVLRTRRQPHGVRLLLPSDGRCGSCGECHFGGARVPLWSMSCSVPRVPQRRTASDDRDCVTA